MLITFIKYLQVFIKTCLPLPYKLKTMSKALDKMYEGILIKIPCPQCNDTGRYDELENGHTVGNFKCDCQDEPKPEMSDERFDEILTIIKPIITKL